MKINGQKGESLVARQLLSAQLTREASAMASRKVIRAARAARAAQAMNEIIRLDADDNEKLLEVIEDYLHPPSECSDTEDSDSDSEGEESALFGGAALANNNNNE